jgi:hypothetical protein
MPLYHFKLIDGLIISDHGVHVFKDDTAAQIEALRLAQSVRETRPELLGKMCAISVTDEDGTLLCLIPIEGV